MNCKNLQEQSATTQAPQLRHVPKLGQWDTGTTKTGPPNIKQLTFSY
jgi:hypothetical protein